MERRSGDRCPVCQGPTVRDQAMPDGVRCRRSTCSKNHEHIPCPRCHKLDLESVEFANATYTYSCRECLHRWQVKG